MSQPHLPDIRAHATNAAYKAPIDELTCIFFQRDAPNAARYAVPGGKGSFVLVAFVSSIAGVRASFPTPLSRLRFGQSPASRTAGVTQLCLR